MEDAMKNSQAKSAKFVMSYVLIATLVIIAGLTYLTMPILRQYQALKSSGPIAATDVNLSANIFHEKKTRIDYFISIFTPNNT